MKQFTAAEIMSLLSAGSTWEKKPKEVQDAWSACHLQKLDFSFWYGLSSGCKQSQFGCLIGCL